jgi:hypothetical protein
LLRTQLLLHRSAFVAIPLYIQQICRLCQERTNASHPITSRHILYILVLELERTFFSSSFSHFFNCRLLCVIRDLELFDAQLAKSQFDGNNPSRACVAKAQLHLL